MGRFWIVPLLGIVSCFLLGSALFPHAPEPTWRERQVQGLINFENRQRDGFDFLGQRSSNRSLGPNPKDIVSLAPGVIATCLEGRDQVLLTTPSGELLHSLAGPPGTGALAWDGQVLYAVGNLSNQIFSYGKSHSGWNPRQPKTIPGALSLVDIQVQGDRIFALDRVGKALFLLTDSLELQQTIELEHRPHQLILQDDWILVLSVLDHTVSLLPLNGGDPIVIEHEGPIWSLACHGDQSGLWLALGGVENKDLDRSQGFFGYIDSFVFLYHLDNQGCLTQVSSTNLSEVGVVTPKALCFGSGSSRPALHVWGYGGFNKATILWDNRKPEVSTQPWPPGTQAVTQAHGVWITANPLLDAWVTSSSRGYSIRPVPTADHRGVKSRLGEALFFTELMAPHNTGEGALSRFTCETCHFEGDGDGRVHFTGRHQIHASTKTLRGLFNNRPYFSRALDETMAEMVNSEFRVANAGAKSTPWFSLNTAGYPWLESWLGMTRIFDAVELRQALMLFLMEFSPAQNPHTWERRAFHALEKQGADLFRIHCESCHQARSVTDSPGTRMAFDTWEAAVFQGSGIVWAQDSYALTGVLPYVHPQGSRIPSLRGVWNKSPLFTNGSARTLREVVETGPRHDGTENLTESEKQALTAFLKLL